MGSVSSEEDIVEKKRKKFKGKKKTKRKSIGNFEKTNKTKSETKGDETKECNHQTEAGPAIEPNTVDLNLDFLDDLVKQSSSLGETNASKECSGKRAEKESVLEVKVNQEPSKCREALDLFNAGAGIFMPTEGISFDMDAFD